MRVWAYEPHRYATRARAVPTEAALNSILKLPPTVDETVAMLRETHPDLLDLYLESISPQEQNDYLKREAARAQAKEEARQAAAEAELLAAAAAVRDTPILRSGLVGLPNPNPLFASSTEPTKRAIWW